MNLHDRLTSILWGWDHWAEWMGWTGWSHRSPWVKMLSLPDYVLDIETSLEAAYERAC